VASAKDRISWKAYCSSPDIGRYDEMVNSEGGFRWAFDRLSGELKTLRISDLKNLQEQAKIAINSLGISFVVYEESANVDRAWPMDALPRIIDGPTWDVTQRGLRQRLTALNMFLDDVYHEGKILADGVVPEALIKSSPHYIPKCAGAKVAFGVWAHICGSDLVRDADGSFYVLEDNLRTPSGVSYMIENREVMMRVAPDLCSDHALREVNDYPWRLFKMIGSLSPRAGEEPTVVILTPGTANSAYFEHAYLARQMGVALAEGSDLTVQDRIVYLRTIEGLKRVDVIYRRLDDDFLDPLALNPDSLIGVPGLFGAWRAGNVALVNAPGCGVADDKVVYSYVPDIIRYYLDEDPIVPNVPTHRLDDKKVRDHVLASPKQFVFKPANASGGKDVVIGLKASKAALESMRRKVLADPRGYVAQPLIELSTSPTIGPKGIVPRRVDLRPFIIQSDRMFVTAGGLTRVALKRGSYIVNSSQGGGSKDTWVIDRAAGGAA